MKRVALFVGINRYDDPEISNLEWAEADAIKLSGLFEHRAHYDDVRQLSYPDSDAMLEVVGQLTAGLSPGDLFLFFFAGHGTVHAGRHLLLDPKAKLAELEYGHHALAVDLLKKKTAKAGVDRVFILDACRNNLVKGERNSAAAGLRDVAALKTLAHGSDHRAGSLSILCSCDEGQQAREIPQCGQGLFSVSLLQLTTEALATFNEIVLSDAFENALASRMARVAAQYGLTVQQRPWISRSGPPPGLLALGGGIQTPTVLPATKEQGAVVTQPSAAQPDTAKESVPQDPAEAVKWYRKAAEQGNASAQFNLGVRYDYGEGVA